MPPPPPFIPPFSPLYATPYPGILPHYGQRQPHKLLARLTQRDKSDSWSLQVALALTTERLESETRRADDAERRVAEVLRTLRLQHDATTLAQAELSRAKEELTMYKFRLEEAQREILRANEAISDLQQEKDMAEDEAARARTTARKYREQQLVARAREEGRREGIQEGFSRGTSSGLDGTVLAEKFGEPGPAAPTVEEMLEEEDPIAPRIQQSALPQPRQSLSRSTISKANQSTHTLDTAHRATTQPIPTLTTPLNIPVATRSRSHTHTSTSISTPHPALPSLDLGKVPPLIPIHEPVVYASPRHPPVDVPPDGWIPYATAGNEEFILPPPHELSRPASPVSVPQPPLILQPAARTQPVWSSPVVPPPPQSIYPRVRQESTTATTFNARKPLSLSSQTVSAPSQASTSISQFDLIKAPHRAKRQFPTWARPPALGEEVLPPLDLRPGERVTLPARLRPQEHGRSSESTKRLESEKDRPATHPFTKLFRGRRRTQSPPIALPVIPDPIIELHSASSAGRASTESRDTLTTPPKPAPRSIASLASQDNIIVMRTEVPGYNPAIPLDPPSIPSLPDSPVGPVIPPLHDQLPPGVIPLTPPLPPDTLPANPIPAPSGMPTPSPSNLITTSTPPPRITPSAPLEVTAPVSESALRTRDRDAPLPSPELDSEAAPVPISQHGAGSSTQ